ncbi:type I-F CRISPR-associated protein Csy1 [Morganella morganii]|uniref:type I-F CRISPR-associated protein Csy1 n=1 Tax=Morganella morganii TaxID=582 RepID=UPI000922DCB9|nr:type I-F CRISPR-associated protein Csy1 [Morganella morganii]SHM00011.1 CRISPR-associated protein Csy1 [Morganella morganii]
MPEPEIIAFFTKYQVSKRIPDFSRLQWLSDAAGRAKQLSLTTHPFAFTHPCARRNRYGKAGAVLAEVKKKNDGFLRSGNVVVPPDVEGNAAALEIYTFLMLKMQDGKTLLAHLCEESETAKKILGSKYYRKLRAGFLQIFSGEGVPVTNSKIKQVFFPVPGKECNAGYHLLSVLTPSGLLFELYRRLGKFAIFPGHLVVIHIGGSKPQNISALNMKNKGKACLLLSVPPGVVTTGGRYGVH